MPNKANQLGLPKAAPLRSASFGIRLFAALDATRNNKDEFRINRKL